MTKYKFYVDLPDSLDPGDDFEMADVDRARLELKQTQMKLNGAIHIDDEITLADAKEQLAKTLAEGPIPEIKMNAGRARTKSEARKNLRRTQALLRKGKEGKGSV